MTDPCADPASAVITEVMNAMKAVFDPASPCPPVGGGSKVVMFFAGDGAPIDEVNCDRPTLWVRLVARFKSVIFPEPAPMVSPCGGLDVIQIELGIVRCSRMGGDITRAQQSVESEIALDDSWRLGKVMCAVASVLDPATNIGTDMVVPYGPEGGLIAWTTNMYVSV